MHGLDVIIRRNNQATERELVDAIEADDLALAFRIADAVISDALAKGVEATWPGYTPEAQAYELATRVVDFCTFYGEGGHVFDGPSYARRACKCGRLFPRQSAA